MKETRTIAILIEHPSGYSVFSPDPERIYLGTWHTREHAISATPYFWYRVQHIDYDLEPPKPELAQVFWNGEWTV